MSSLGELTEDVWVVIARHMDVETVVILSGKCSKEAGKKPTSLCFANEMHRLTFSFLFLPTRSTNPPPLPAVCKKFHGLMHTLPVSVHDDGKPHGLIKTGKSKAIEIIAEAWHNLVFELDWYVKRTSAIPSHIKSTHKLTQTSMWCAYHLFHT